MGWEWEENGWKWVGKTNKEIDALLRALDPEKYANDIELKKVRIRLRCNVANFHIELYDLLEKDNNYTDIKIQELVNKLANRGIGDSLTLRTKWVVEYKANDSDRFGDWLKDIGFSDDEASNLVEKLVKEKHGDDDMTSDGLRIPH